MKYSGGKILDLKEENMLIKNILKGEIRYGKN